MSKCKCARDQHNTTCNVQSQYDTKSNFKGSARQSAQVNCMQGASMTRYATYGSAWHSAACNVQRVQGLSITQLSMTPCKGSASHNAACNAQCVMRNVQRVQKGSA
eukprot:1150795-Pelagomonas_calceolata.AAC.3